VHAPAHAPDADRFARTAGIAIIIGLIVTVILVLGIARYDVQLYLLLLTAIVIAAIPLIRRAVRVEPSISARFLALALALKIAGSMLRYLVLLFVYDGSGDATGYHASGVAFYDEVRRLDFSFLQPPYTETESIRHLAAFVYAIIGPSMPAGFLFFAMLSFLGQWWFYRAFRVAFPEGNHRMYALFLFLLPSMLYWPSSLGKDAVMVFGLGLATYGLARLLRQLSVRPVIAFAVGTAAATIVRPAVGAIVVGAAAVAFIIQPSRTKVPVGRALVWLLGIPIIALFTGFMLINAANSLRIEATADAFQKYEQSQEGLYQGGSGFAPPDVSNPLGVASAGFTALFRPFPWEIGNALVGLAGIEGLVILGLFVVKFRSVLRTVRAWRNGMAIAVTIISILLTAVLSAFTNFGILVRQRTSLLPFLLMLPFAYPVAKRAPRLKAMARRAAHRADANPEPVEVA
jgi:hypothetical protein